MMKKIRLKSLKIHGGKNPCKIWLQLTLGKPLASHGCSPFYLFLPAQDHLQWLKEEETLKFLLMKILTPQAQNKEHTKLLPKASQQIVSLTSGQLWIVLTSFFTFSAISAFNSLSKLLYISRSIGKNCPTENKIHRSEAIKWEPKKHYQSGRWWKWPCFERHGSMKWGKSKIAQQRR